MPPSSKQRPSQSFKIVEICQKSIPNVYSACAMIKKRYMEQSTLLGTNYLLCYLLWCGKIISYNVILFPRNTEILTR